jgi:hypothetical protein
MVLRCAFDVRTRTLTLFDLVEAFDNKRTWMRLASAVFARRYVDCTIVELDSDLRHVTVNYDKVEAFAHSKIPLTKLLAMENEKITLQLRHHIMSLDGEDTFEAHKQHSSRGIDVKEEFLTGFGHSA